MTDDEVVLILKSSLKDPVDVNNYRPIAIAQGATKFIGQILLVRLGKLISTSCYQFGFEENHSTEVCVFAVKETIDYYRKLGAPTFACSIDINSALDLVCHSRLFEKLSRRGTLACILQLLNTWYSQERLR